MNKFAIFALTVLAAASVASAENAFGRAFEGGIDEDLNSEAMIPTNSEEVAYLKPENQIFKDFCIQSRDEVKNFLTMSTNQAIAGVFAAFFDSVGEAGTEVLDVQKQSVEEAAEAIKNNVDPQPVPENAQEAHENLEKAAEKISLIQSISNGAKYVLSTVVDAAKSELATRISLVRKQFEGDNIKEQLMSFCDNISLNLKKDLGRRFNEFKSTAKKSAGGLPNAAEVHANLQSVTVDNVGCLTLGRINKVSQVCNLMRVAGPALFPILGIN